MSKIKYFSENLEVQSKTIILRLDLNVPLNEKKIQDKSRILTSLPFLKDLMPLAISSITRGKRPAPNNKNTRATTTGEKACSREHSTSN